MQGMPSMFTIVKDFIAVLANSMASFLSSEPMIYFVGILFAFLTLGLLLKIIR